MAPTAYDTAAAIDASKRPGDLIPFREIQDLLGVDKMAAAGVIHQVRIQREKAGKRTLVTMRGAGWLLARPDQELEEDTRRHEHLLNAAEGRIRLLGSVQGRRAELTEEERRTLDFKQAQAAAQATVLGSGKHQPPTSSAQTEASMCRSRRRRLRRLRRRCRCSGPHPPRRQASRPPLVRPRW